MYPLFNDMQGMPSISSIEPAVMAADLGTIVLLLGVIALAIALSRTNSAVARLESRLDQLSRTPPPAPPEPPVAPSAPAPVAGVAVPTSASLTPVQAAMQAARHNAPEPQAGVSAEDFAIIAAAITSLLGQNARIVTISPHNAQQDQAAWSVEGRRYIYQGRNVRR
jgi:hypothetical protein